MSNDNPEPFDVERAAREIELAAPEFERRDQPWNQAGLTLVQVSRGLLAELAAARRDAEQARADERQQIVAQLQEYADGWTFGNQKVNEAFGWAARALARPTPVAAPQDLDQALTDAEIANGVRPSDEELRGRLAVGTDAAPQADGGGSEEQHRG